MVITLSLYHIKVPIQMAQLPHQEQSAIETEITESRHQETTTTKQTPTVGNQLVLGFKLGIGKL